jgi:hypothetical protein
MRLISSDGVRAIDDQTVLGFACYVGASARGDFVGMHIGVHGCHAAAIYWLRDGYPMPRPVLPSPPAIRVSYSRTLDASELVRAVALRLTAVEPGSGPY